MKSAIKMSVSLLLFSVFIGVLCWHTLSAAIQDHSLPKIAWMNESVYYTTNSMVYDVDRNKTNPPNSVLTYVKTVVETNKVKPFYFWFGDKAVELGAREDGVIVWRNRL